MQQNIQLTGSFVFRLKSLFITAALLCVALSGFAQTPFSSLEERMTFEEFRNAGLEKLSEEELTQLNRWIRSHSLGGEEAVLVAAANRTDYPSGFNPDRIGFQDYRGENVPITARINGSFNGWLGDTVFELDNGQVWRQVQQDKLGVRERQNPEVVIEPGLFGSWYLTLEGINKRIQVKRIE